MNVILTVAIWNPSRRLYPIFKEFMRFSFIKRTLDTLLLNIQSMYLCLERNNISYSNMQIDKILLCYFVLLVVLFRVILSFLISVNRFKEYFVFSCIYISFLECV